MRDLIGRVRETFDWPDYSLYRINDVDQEVNKTAIRNIKTARAALNIAIDKERRKTYERDLLTRLPDIAFEPALFEATRRKAIEALSDVERSPCAYFSGDQAERQGIPRAEITRPLRCFTKDVQSTIPDAPQLIDDNFVHAIRSCIGSHFSLYDIGLTRNYHVPAELSAKYDILSDRWHFDHKYLDIFYLFVNLSHVSMEDGPTHMLNAPDSRKALKLGFKCDLREKDPNCGLDPRTIEAMSSLTRCTGPSGTMLMSHTSLCLHKASALEPGRVRDLMLFSFRHSNEMEISWEAVRRASAG